MSLIAGLPESARFAGVDLAAQPRNTAMCVLVVTGGRVQAAELEHGVEDCVILEELVDPAVVHVGIDAPFGWPETFIDTIRSYREKGTWPDQSGGDAAQNAMRLRETDRATTLASGATPLSVAADRIAVVAMRCARLLAAYWREAGVEPDRLGRGKPIEVYPAAALRMWRLSQHDHSQDPGSYKGGSAGARRRRQRIVSEISRFGEGSFELDPVQEAACVQSDHVLDALLSSLVALAAGAGAVIPPPSDAPASEGWISLPGISLSELLTGRSRPAAKTEPEILMPPDGYLELQMPDLFTLEIQDRVGGPWGVWAGGLKRRWFVREPDGSYFCTDHGGSPIYFRALSVDVNGMFEHIDGCGSGQVYRYRLRPEAPQ